MTNNNNKIFNALNTPVLLLDNKAKLIFVNKIAEKFLGKNSSKFLDKKINYLIPSLKSNYIVSGKNSFNNKKFTFDSSVNDIEAKLDVSSYRENGSKFYILSFSKSTQIENKSLHKNNSELLADSKKLNALFNNVDVMLWSVIKNEKGVYYYDKVNTAFASATNRKTSDYNGKLLRQLGSPTDFKAIVRSLNIAKKKGVYTYHRDLVHRGKKRYFILRIIYVKGRKNIEYYIGSGVDITPVKRSEELLKLSEKKYRDFAEFAPIALTRVDPKRRKLDFVNKEFARMTGFTLNEYNSLTAKQRLNLIYPEDRERLVYNYDQWVKNGYKGVLHIHYRFKNKYKNILWLDAYFNAELNIDGTIYAINQMYLDITETKRAEELARLNEKMFRDLAQYSPFAIAYTDVNTRLYSYVNKEFTRQSGYTKFEFNSLTNKQIDDLVYFEDREKHKQAISKWVKGGYKGVLHTDYRVINKRGEILWLDAYLYAQFDEENNLRSINQIYIDVTDQKNAEQRIRIFANAIESANEMVSIADPNNRFVYANKAFLETMGYTEKEVIGKTPEFLFSKNISPDLKNEILTAATRNSWSGELMNVRKNGSEIPIYLNLSKITDNTGKLIGVIALAEDMTQLKKTQEELRNSLLEKELLLKEVYHRVKNNLQVINSLLQIQTMSAKDEETKEMLKENQRRIRIMYMIHEKLYTSKDLAKIDFSNYLYNLVDYIKDSYHMASDKIDIFVNTQNVSLGLNKAIPCGMIVNELVSNSCKYAFEPGQKGFIKVGLNIDKNNLYRLIIEDNGKGLPADLDFKKTESLGMVIINSFVGQLEGTIDLVKTKGTKFIIKFPA